MPRINQKAAAFDAACVVAMVIIGTRNHDTDTGLSGVAFVVAPFLIGLAVAQLVFLRASVDIRSAKGGLIAAAVTVTVGMSARNIFFDRGTALAFIIVATVFLGLSMSGWRAIARRRA